MFEKILYPTDFSNVAEKALSYIKKLKDSGAREVVVLHVIDERGFERFHQFIGDEKYEAMKKTDRKTRKNDSTLSQKNCPKRVSK